MPASAFRNVEDTPPQILIVRVGAMGDVLHALPAAALMRGTLPGAVLHWAIDPRWTPLLQADRHAVPGSAAMPLVDAVHEVPTRAWSRKPFSVATLRNILTLRRELRRCRYDLAIDLQGSLRSAIIAWMSGARIVTGAAAPREAPARWFYNHRVPTPAVHVIDQAIEIARGALAAFGYAVATTESSAGPIELLPRDDASEAWARNVWESNDASADDPFRKTRSSEAPFQEVRLNWNRQETRAKHLVFLAPTAGWGAKQWPAERFGALAAALIEHGFWVVINASPPLPDAVAQRVSDAACELLPAARRDRLQVVAATLPQLIALLRRVSLVVAGDTGPLHLAAALGVTVVGLFGPTSPARNGPHTAGGIAESSIVLRDPASMTDHRRHPATEAGLARIPVDTVLEAALRLLLPPQ